MRERQNVILALKPLSSFYPAIVRPCLLLGGTVFVILSLSTAYPGPKQSSPFLPRDKRALPALPAPDMLCEVNKALRATKSPREARSLERRAETLRQRGLSAGTRLLLQSADFSLRSRDYRKAESALNNALVLQPDKAFISRSRARLRYAAGDFEGAISDLGVALHQDPDDPLSWQLLSLIEEERRDLKAALKAAQQVLAVDPLAEGATKRVETLKAALIGRPI